MKKINQKLRNKIKELNTVVEKAIDKANQKKLTLAKRETVNEPRYVLIDDPDNKGKKISVT